MSDQALRYLLTGGSITVVNHIIIIIIIPNSWPRIFFGRINKLKLKVWAVKGNVKNMLMSTCQSQDGNMWFFR